MTPALIELFAYCLCATVAGCALQSAYSAYRHHCIAARWAAGGAR